MLAQQRQTAILRRVREGGAVRVSDLVGEFGVSDMTIRRDLEVLAERGLLTKVHGGATTILPGSTDEPEFATKVGRQHPEKAAIAARAAQLVEPGSAVALSGGTTTAELARHLIEVPRLTVVTNSVPVAEIMHLGGRTDQTVILTGGVRTLSDSLVGPIAVATVRSLHVDALFLGVSGMSERAGFTTPNLMEAETDRALVDAAARLFVLADHTKYGTVGICSVAELSDAEVLVSDSGMPEDVQSLLEAKVGSLVLAEVTKL